MTLVKLATRIAVPLMFGALVTWVVAWCAVIRAGSIIESLEDMQPATMPNDWELAPAEGWADEARVKDAWGAEIVLSAAGAGVEGGFVWRVRAGWPMLALESWETFEETDEYGGPLRKGVVAFTPTGEIHLPTRPRAIPFLVNTTCFGVLCFALFGRRGVSASRCPECGGGAPKLPIFAWALSSVSLASVIVVATAWGVLLAPAGAGVPAPLSPLLGRTSSTTTSWTNAIFRDPDRAPWVVVPPGDWPRESVRFSAPYGVRFGQLQRRAFGRLRPTLSAEWTASGWPLCAIESRRFHASGVGPAEASFDRGIPISRGGSTRYIPLRPMLVPFAFNTAVFAAGLFLLRAAIWNARQWSRHRRVQCLRCGYSLAGLREPAA